MATPAPALFAGMHRAFTEYWRDVRVLAYGEAPDYARLRGHFVSAWERSGSWVEAPGEIDWLKAYSELQSQEEEHLRRRREKFQRPSFDGKIDELGDEDVEVNMGITVSIITGLA
ncbi:hypothetical protein HYPSUDRAFT_202450 [Hypholoma sublateritium FD-334 SS-4]|uniref:Uncharacterized protein n=1 Tax=Hypholoma sublateritium (strain FD-334 SS-4) TaxID=945553 RepID=A0A0D2MED9_HYPSF|nr:hypothetical protein HYPSUDRAFT_202450 [Hypholoma sublateritium FD-334 SS-4]